MHHVPDVATLRALMSGPGSDTRQWISYGTVALVTEGVEPVEFDTVETHQILVSVDLHPSNLPVQCRVAASVAGQGEGESYPFVPGDEVIVAIPQGDEKAGCCIIGRLNNSFDKHPTQVAGLPVKENKFGYKRMIAPYVIETASSYLIRSVKTGAFIGIDQAGNVTIGTSDGHVMTMNTDYQGFQTKDGESAFQVQASGDIVAQAGKNQIRLSKTDDTFIISAKNIRLSAAGAAPVQHALSLEQFLSVYAQIQTALAVRLTAAGPPLAALGALLTPVLVDKDMAAALPLAAANGLTLSPTTSKALPLALAAPSSPTKELYGVGCPSLLIG